MNIDLIKKAVISWDGKFKPDCDFVVIYNDDGNYAACSTPELTYKPILFSRAQFEEVAKRMGFINGYKWGVEYPTNGKRPDLPLDVKVKFSIPMCIGAFSLILPNALYSADGATFVITDERYKPEQKEVPEESAAAFFERRSPTVYGTREPLPDAKPVEPEPKSWYVAGELPPVGEVVMVNIFQQGSHEATVISAFQRWVWLDVKNKGIDTFDVSYIRPISTEREKTIIAACKVMKTAHHTVVSNLKLLYDAGLLRLPDNKNKD